MKYMAMYGVKVPGKSTLWVVVEAEAACQD